MKKRSFLLLVGILLSLLIGGLFSEPITPVYAVVTVSSISPENNTITLDTTPDFTCTPTSNVSATVNVTLYIDDIASGTVNNHANNTEITITCNHTLSESDIKKPWYFNVTDADGTYSSETRNVGIGQYFTCPAVLTNENATSEHWNYCLNASISSYSSNTPISIPDNNITLNGQYYMLDADEVALVDDGILVERSSPGQTTTITIENISLSGWDDSSIHLHYADGNTLGNITANDCWDFSIWLEYSDRNTISNVTASDCNNRGFEFDHAFNNTISNVTAENNNNRGIGLSSCDFNIISDSTINNCYRGIFFSYADSNTVYDCIIQNSIGSGIYMAFSGSTQNTFYNNLFNNTVNVDQSGTPQLNYWNTTKQIGTRIHSNGLYIGGNYWTNSAGTGDSDTGTDSNHDGFLDDTLTISISNYDYLAYSDEGNPTLYLQARDSDGANLPRQVTFKGTLGNGTSFNENSDSSGYLALATCYGTHTVNTWWGEHLIDSSHSISVTSDKSENINTKIRLLYDGSNYIVMSVNITTIPAITYTSVVELKLPAVAGSGLKELKLDNLNWVEAGQPYLIKYGDYEKNRASANWDWSDNILKVPISFSTIDITVYWSEKPSPPSGGPSPGPGPIIIPVEPEEEEEEPVIPVMPSLPFEPPPPSIEFGADITTAGLLIVVIIVITDFLSDT